MPRPPNFIQLLYSRHAPSPPVINSCCTHFTVPNLPRTIIQLLYAEPRDVFPVDLMENSVEGGADEK